MLKRIMLCVSLCLILSGSAFATTFTLNLVQGGAVGSDFMQRSRVHTIARTIDFTIPAAANTTVTATCLTQVFNVPAQTYVLGIFTNVTVAEGTTCTVKVGDTATNNNFATALNLNSVATTWTFNATGTPVAGVGKYYSAANTIQLYHNHTTKKTVVTFKLVYLDLSQ